MTQYSHLLVAVDVDDDGRRVLARAQALAASLDARLSCLHVVEYLPVDPAADAMLSTPIDLSQERAKQAQSRLDDWQIELGLAPGTMQVRIGAVTAEILRTRDELGADLLVVGHHSRNGLMALFSRTDDGVLSRARCDFLAVHLDPDDED